MSKTKLAAVRGMNDLLPGDSALWEWFESKVTSWVRSYGYQLMRTPLVEPTELFVRGIGEVTDIVEKEMYSFEDRLNGERLTLRPEFTAGIVRATIEHNLTYDGPRRVWSMGPLFRHERPQRGRYRQFHQVDVEALGLAGPDIDAELMIMLARLWRILGVEPLRLELNCLGQAEERAKHRDALIAHFEANAGVLDADAQRRLHSNPLRILDSKNPAMAAVIEAAPRITDFLGDTSRAFFDRVQALLTAADVPYHLNPRMVRGLDYYNLTVFEWTTDALGAQGTVCGGGRYDPLIVQLGGKPTPACGFGIGVERVLELIKARHAVTLPGAADVYVLHQGAETQVAAFKLAEQMRDAGLNVLMHAGEASMKSQMKRADGSGAEYAVIVGQEEWAEGKVSIKALRMRPARPEGHRFATQERIPLEIAGKVLAETFFESLD